MKNITTKLLLLFIVVFYASCSNLRYPESYLTKAPKKEVKTEQKENLKKAEQTSPVQIASTEKEQSLLDKAEVKKESDRNEQIITEKPPVTEKQPALEKKTSKIEQKLNRISEKKNEFQSKQNLSSLSNTDLLTIILVVLLIVLVLSLLPGNVAYLIVVLALIFLILYLLGVI